MNLNKLSIDNVFTTGIVNRTKENIKHIIITWSLSTKELLSMLKKEHELVLELKNLIWQQDELILLYKQSLWE